MISYVSKYKIICDSQNGFCPNKSTESASYNLVKYVYDHLDNKRLVGAIFFDLSKAFDTIDLHIIENKLYALGFRGNFLAWLMSYLSGRKYVVCIDDYLSDMYDAHRVQYWDHYCLYFLLTTYHHT
nr:unnamed protein product [Callosobruchus analis]